MWLSHSRVPSQGLTLGSHCRVLLQGPTPGSPHPRVSLQSYLMVPSKGPTPGSHDRYTPQCPTPEPHPMVPLQGLFLIKLQDTTQAQVPSSEYYENFKNTYFSENLQTVAPVNSCKQVGAACAK